jgi:hypothetical protein
MNKINFLLTLEFVILSLLIDAENNVKLVAGQVVTDPASWVQFIPTALVGTLPLKFLNLIQILLLGRLFNARNNNNPQNGNGNEEENEFRKNFMLFLGRHNIQVSNHGMKTSVIQQLFAQYYYLYLSFQYKILNFI